MILGVKTIGLIFINIILINEMFHFILENLNSVGIVNIMENVITIHPKLFDCLRSNLSLQVFHVDYFVKIYTRAVNTIFPSRKFLPLVLPFLAVWLVV